MKSSCNVQIGGAIGTLIGSAIVALLPAWLTMLALGAIHNDVDPRCPAVGYLFTYVVYLALGAVNRLMFGGPRAVR